MRPQILVLLFLNLFQRTSCSEQPTELACQETLTISVEQTTSTTQTAQIMPMEEAAQIEQTGPSRVTLYPHTVGIQNPKFNCYMNALFACLYSNPFFQNSVYESINEIPENELPKKSESVLMALGDLFVKMRLDRRPVSLKPAMFPAIRLAFDWRVGEYQCVLEFWGQFVEKMPESFNQLFQAKIKTNYHRKSDDKLIKSIPDDYCYINIPAPQTPVYLSEIINGHFLDLEAEDYGIIPADQHEYLHILDGPIEQKLYIPVYSTVEFENAPTVLAFGIKRLGWNRATEEPELNETAIEFDEITVRGEKYLPCGFVIFDSKISHYFAVVNDFGNNSIFIQNDSKQTVVDYVAHPEDRSYLANSISMKSVMVFYVKVSASDKLNESELKHTIMKDEDISPVLLKKRADLALQAELKRFPATKKRRANSISGSYAQRKKVKKASKPNTSEIETGETEEEENGAIRGATEDIEEDVYDELIIPTEEASETVNEEDFNEEDDIDEEENDSVSISSYAVGMSFDEGLLSSATTVTLTNAEESKEIEKISESTGATTSNSVNISSFTKVTPPQPDFDDNLLDVVIDKVAKELESEIQYLGETNNRVDAQYNANTLYTQNQPMYPQHQVIDFHVGQSILYTPIPTTSLISQGFAHCKAQNPVHYVSQGYKQQIQSQTQVQQFQQPPQQQQQQHRPEVQVPNQNRLPLSFSLLSPEEQERAEIIFKTHISKFTDTSYQMGTENFSFSEDSSCLPLEMILTAFASNSSFLFALIGFIEVNRSESLKYLTFVVIQMLIGYKDINTNNLKRLIDTEFKIKISNRDTTISFEKKVSYCLNFFSKMLPDTLLKFPTIKTIVFSELDTDEPLKISHRQFELPVFNPKNTIKARLGNFSGVFVDANQNGNRLRSLVSSPNGFFPIITPRFQNTGEFISDSFNPSSNDHTFFGCIKYGPRDNVFNYSAQFFSNYSSNTIVTYDSVSGAKITKYALDDYSARSNVMNSEFFTHSYVAFAIKTTMTQDNPVKLSQIPRKIVLAVMIKIKMEIIALSPSMRHQMKKFQEPTPDPIVNVSSQRTDVGTRTYPCSSLTAALNNNSRFIPTTSSRPLPSNWNGTSLLIPKDSNMNQGNSKK